MQKIRPKIKGNFDEHVYLDYRPKVPAIRLPKNINTEEELESHLIKNLVLEDYMGNYLDFIALYNDMFTVFVNCYPIKDLRNHTVPFKLYHSDKMEYGLQFKRFILALPIFGALQSVWNTVHIGEEFLMVNYDSKTFNALTEDVNYLLQQYEIPIHVRSAIQTDLYYRYTQLAYTLADVINMTLSMEDYLIPYVTVPDMKELTDTPIPSTLQPVEVKALILERSNKLKKIYESINNNGIGIIIRSKTKINERQFQEMNISHGEIPDVYGTFIARVMKNNGFNRGLESPGDYYLAESVSRYSAIVNNDDMGEVGYFFRNVSIDCGTLKLSDKIHDCHTNHYLKYVVDDLRFIEGKYYKENLGDNELKIVHRTDTHLIGKTIYIRSMIYCACGDEVCHVCYGEDYKYIEDLPGMGIFNAQVILNPVYQKLLSVKHAIDGEIQAIGKNQNFEDIFKIVENFIDVQDDIDSEDYLLLIEKKVLDAMDYRNENYGLATDPVIFVVQKGQSEVKRCELNNIQDITYNTAIIHAMKPSKKYPEYYQCPLSILDKDGVINITILNYGVSDVLNDFKKLIKYDSSDYTIERFVAEIINTVRKAKIPAKLPQVEVIVNRLVRDPKDLTRRPNYSNDVCDEVILSISKAIMNTKGVPVRLAFEQTKKQVLSPASYDRYGEAYTQPLLEIYQYNRKNEN